MRLLLAAAAAGSDVRVFPSLDRPTESYIAQVYDDAHCHSRRRRAGYVPPVQRLRPGD